MNKEREKNKIEAFWTSAPVGNTLSRSRYSQFKPTQETPGIH